VSEGVYEYKQHTLLEKEKKKTQRKKTFASTAVTHHDLKRFNSGYTSQLEALSRIESHHDILFGQFRTNATAPQLVTHQNLFELFSKV
jgi:hypothetical protein